jgi:peptide/nickel transport system substrate-binding protein
MGKDGFFGWNPNVPAYEYDVEKAKALLAEAGYNGEKVQLLSERGRWLKDGEVTEAIGSMLMEAGFNVEVKIVSWNEWLDTLFDKSKTPDMQFSSTSNDYFDMDRTYSALVHSSGTQAAINNPELDKQIEAARSELDVAKRQQMYYDLAQQLHDDPFAIYLLSTNDLHGGAANLNWTLRKDSKIILSEISFS